MNILAAPCDAGRLAALLAGAEARGIKVLLPRNDSDAYIVSHGVYVRAVESLDELAALLAKMGVKETQGAREPVAMRPELLDALETVALDLNMPLTHPRVAPAVAKISAGLAGGDPTALIDAQNALTDLIDEARDLRRGAGG